MNMDDVQGYVKSKKLFESGEMSYSKSRLSTK